MLELVLRVKEYSCNKYIHIDGIHFGERKLWLHYDYDKFKSEGFTLKPQGFRPICKLDIETDKIIDYLGARNGDK